jgi:hypothetical protein
MMLAERLLLLCWDADRGTPAAGVHATRLRRALAAAILAELALRRRLDGTADALSVPDNLPDYTALTGEGAAILRRSDGAISAAAAVRRLESRMPRLRSRIVASLVRRDVLHQYGVPLFRRHPVRSMQALQAAHAELVSCSSSRTPTPAALALAAILDGSGLLVARVTRDDATAIRAALARSRTGTMQSGVAGEIDLLLAIGASARTD